VSGGRLWEKGLRNGGTKALVDLFRSEDGEAFDREFPPWAQAVMLRADPEALLAAHAPELWAEGVPYKDPGSCAASELAIPTARAFLDRWFPW
jgi:hypothetical protein